MVEKADLERKKLCFIWR